MQRREFIIGAGAVAVAAAVGLPAVAKPLVMDVQWQASFKYGDMVWVAAVFGPTCVEVTVTKGDRVLKCTYSRELQRDLHEVYGLSALTVISDTLVEEIKKDRQIGYTAKVLDADGHRMFVAYKGGEWVWGEKQPTYPFIPFISPKVISDPIPVRSAQRIASL